MMEDGDNFIFSQSHFFRMILIKGAGERFCCLMVQYKDEE